MIKTFIGLISDMETDVPTFGETLIFNSMINEGFIKEICFYFFIYRHSPMFWCKYNMVLTSPTCMV